MKKSILIYLLALLPFADTFAQNSSSCGASCFFTWCTITCYNPKGDLIGAQCYCSWGFAHCKCLRSSSTNYTYSSNYSVNQTADQRAALAAFQQELADNGYESLASVVSGIQGAIDREEYIGDLVENFEEIADGLPESDQQFIKDRIGPDGEVPLPEGVGTEQYDNR